MIVLQYEIAQGEDGLTVFWPFDLQIVGSVDIDLDLALAEECIVALGHVGSMFVQSIDVVGWSVDELALGGDA